MVTSHICRRFRIRCYLRYRIFCSILLLSEKFTSFSVFIGLLNISDYHLYAALSNSLVFLSVFDISTVLETTDALFVGKAIVDQHFSETIRQDIVFLFSRLISSEQRFPCYFIKMLHFKMLLIGSNPFLYSVPCTLYCICLLLFFQCFQQFKTHFPCCTTCLLTSIKNSL